jgi:hypothetical protein
LTSIPPDVAADIKRQAVALERIATTLEGTAKAAIFDAKHKAGQ